MAAKGILHPATRRLPPSRGAPTEAVGRPRRKQNPGRRPGLWKDTTRRTTGSVVLILRRALRLGVAGLDALQLLAEVRLLRIQLDRLLLRRDRLVLVAELEVRLRQRVL